MKHLSRWALAALVTVAACSDSSQDSPLAPPTPDLNVVPSGVARVTNANDAGPGSFRAAVEKANANPSIRKIDFGSRIGTIWLATPVVYSGTQSLDILADGATLDGSALAAGATSFLATGGGDLSLVGLTVRNTPGEGITVQVPSISTGTKKVSLIKVVVSGNLGHGVLINDQVDPDDTANPAGSDASLDVVVIASRFSQNGFGALDRDGLRINEGGLGNLVALVSLTRSDGNGADGIEFDERGVGDVVFNVSATQLTGNGSFDQTLTDLDDGFDIDESNEGSLIGKVIASSANDNLEEGFDFNENHEGDFRVDMTLVEASRNVEEGVDFEEDDDFQGGGDLITTLIGIKANGNGPGGDGGLKIRERGDGNLQAKVVGATTQTNTNSGINIREQQAGDAQVEIQHAIVTGNGTGIVVREDDAGNLTATITNATADGNTGNGIDFDENSTGDLTATVATSSSSTNGGVGVRADQQLVSGAGVGALQLTTVVLNGNTGGPFVANAGVTVTQTP